MMDCPPLSWRVLLRLGETAEEARLAEYEPNPTVPFPVEYNT